MIKRVVTITSGVESLVDKINDFIKNGYDVDLLVDYDMGEDEKSIVKYKILYYAFLIILFRNIINPWVYIFPVNTFFCSFR